MSQSLVKTQTATTADHSYPVPRGEDPQVFQRNEAFLHRWRWFSEDATETPESTMQSNDTITQSLRPFTGQLRVGEMWDTNRFEDVRANKFRMGQQPGPAQQRKFNEFVARNAAIEHWGADCGLAKYHTHIIDNWDSKPASVPHTYKQQ